MANILVIDDEELARYTVREILQSAGHAVTEAGNGNEGIKLQHEHRFDLVITDIIMPEKEGVETIIELKRDYPDLKIIGVSGGGRARNLHFLDISEQFGADKVLKKPFTYDQLMECVDACLADRRTGLTPDE